MSKREPQFCSKCTSQRVCIGTRKCVLWESFARAEFMEPLMGWQSYKSTLPPPEEREQCRDCESTPIVMVRDRLCGECWLHRWAEEPAA
jgi:hypothetical protein